jgi:acyl-coenzyme A synthetase/AMP-(fatty) acid ligase
MTLGVVPAVARRHYPEAVTALTLLWPAVPLSLLPMHSANPDGPEAPAYFNFASDVTDRWALERPDALALWWASAGTGAEQRFTFRQVAALSCQAASFLRSCGVRRGDRVLLMLPRVPQWWIAMVGLIRLGAVPVPATLLLTQRDVTYRLKNAEVTAIITNPEGIAKVEGFSGLRLLVGPPTANGRSSLPPDWIDFDRGLGESSPAFRGERTRGDDPGILYFTSATTGEPKMVLHTQASYGLGHRLTGELWLDLKPHDVHWNLSDLGWGKAAWSSFYGPWQMGACVFALDAPGKFDPVLTLNTLAAYPITTWCAPPTALRLIVRQDLSRWRFPHLRHCVTAGEPLNPEVLNLWREATGLTLHEGYGQTETVVLIGNCRSLGHPVRPGSMGKAVPGFTIALLDERLQEVPPGQEGEVAVRVKPHRPVGLFSDYWRNAQEGAAHFRGDWYLTGDRATRDADGYFWFIGRKDDVIKSSGYRIGPFEVESALLEHPAVLEAAVIGLPDALRGQIVKACVVLRPEIAASDQLKVELQCHCKRLIAAYKYPREIAFVPELPKTTSGKTRRVELRQASSIPNQA